MEVVHSRCAGLDVHKDTVVACVRLAENGRVERHVQTFKTTTAQLCALSDWLGEQGCTHVGMEATGVYWKPVWHVLEGQVELVLAKAADVKNVPGRKSDVSDAEWLADLLAHGLIRGSYVPEANVQTIRELTRTRKQLVRESTRHVQRIQKVLEDANVKLSSVISDIVGKTGRAILNAMVQGETDPKKLVGYVHGRIQATHDEIAEALRGHVTDHHRFELRLHLKLLDNLGEAVKEVEARLGTALEPFQATLDRLMTIPGISQTTAHVIAGEVGLDVAKFPTAQQLVSWVGLCPRMDESAGKRRDCRIREGNAWLKSSLVQAAWGAIRVKNSYLRAHYNRIKARRGAKKAIVAVAATIATAIWHMLRNGTNWIDLGADYFNKMDKHRLARRLTLRLESLGYRVDVRPSAA